MRSAHSLQIIEPEFSCINFKIWLWINGQTSEDELGRSRAISSRRRMSSSSLESSSERTAAIRRSSSAMREPRTYLPLSSSVWASLAESVGQIAFVMHHSVVKFNSLFKNLRVHLKRITRKLKINVNTAEFHTGLIGMSRLLQSREARVGGATASTSSSRRSALALRSSASIESSVGVRRSARSTRAIATANSTERVIPSSRLTRRARKVFAVGTLSWQKSATEFWMQRRFSCRRASSCRSSSWCSSCCPSCSNAGSRRSEHGSADSALVSRGYRHCEGDDPVRPRVSSGRLRLVARETRGSGGFGCAGPPSPPGKTRWAVSRTGSRSSLPRPRCWCPAPLSSRPTTKRLTMNSTSATQNSRMGSTYVSWTTFARTAPPAVPAPRTARTPLHSRLNTQNKKHWKHFLKNSYRYSKMISKRSRNVIHFLNCYHLDQHGSNKKPPHYSTCSWCETWVPDLSVLWLIRFGLSNLHTQIRIALIAAASQTALVWREF